MYNENVKVPIRLANVLYFLFNEKKQIVHFQLVNILYVALYIIILYILCMLYINAFFLSYFRNFILDH